MSVREQNSRKKILMGEDHNALTWLIILNAMVFVSILFIKVIYDLTMGHSQSTDFNIDSWVAMPAEWLSLSNTPMDDDYLHVRT